jgi:hypothetical protein
VSRGGSKQDYQIRRLARAGRREAFLVPLGSYLIRHALPSTKRTSPDRFYQIFSVGYANGQGLSDPWVGPATSCFVAVTGHAAAMVHSPELEPDAAE